MTFGWNRRSFRCPHVLTVAILTLGMASAVSTHAASSEPLVLESKSPLDDVRGRIDHLTIDVARNRLYVAELGNDSVGVLDLQERRGLKRRSPGPAPPGRGVSG